MALNTTLRRKQVEQGGMYSIPERYTDVEDLLPSINLTD
jgi:hypothetical protein